MDLYIQIAFYVVTIFMIAIIITSIAERRAFESNLKMCIGAIIMGCLWPISLVTLIVSLLNKKSV